VLILAMTAEWSQRTAMSTFTLEPRRGRVLTAKIVTGLGVSLLGACFALAVSELVVVAARAAGRDIASGWSWPQFAGSVVFILLTGATGIAVGALLHNTAAAIVTYFALGAVFNLFTIPALEEAGRCQRGDDDVHQEAEVSGRQTRRPRPRRAGSVNHDPFGGFRSYFRRTDWLSVMPHPASTRTCQILAANHHTEIPQIRVISGRCVC
jgi:hypothetical protein